MRRYALSVIGAACLGCAAADPVSVLEESTYAFARGDAELGARHFSERLLAARPVKALQAYYVDPEHRAGMEFLLRDHHVRVLEEGAAHALVEVTWTTGRTEQVHFVREGGAWKIDLPPSPRASAGRPARSSPAEGTDASPQAPAPSAPGIPAADGDGSTRP